MSPTVVILLVASCVAASCALLGTFLVLRRTALLGDAISHAVLPGIVIAFLITGDRAALPMVLGAGALGIVTVLLVELFNRTQRLKEDASIGVVFPALFSLGVILISRFASQVDLDLDCVLYGEIAYAPLDTLTWRGIEIGPKALWVNGSILLVDALFVVLLYKELQLTTFDAPLAATLGFSPMLMHYSLMSLVSVTIVGAFESVGAILVVAMLVVPAAAAYLLTDRLGTMLGMAVGIGVAAAVGGYWLAHQADASIAGAMATVAGVLFGLAFVLSPRYGIVARLLRHRRLGSAMAEQLLLLHLGDSGPGTPLAELTTRFRWPPQRIHGTVARLERRGWIERTNGAVRLTASGEAALAQSGQLPLRHRAAGLA